MAKADRNTVALSGPPGGTHRVLPGHRLRLAVVDSDLAASRATGAPSHSPEALSIALPWSLARAAYKR